MTDSYDCIVCGGGIVGLTTALALARAARRVLLLDAGDEPQHDGAGAHDLRVSTLNLASYRVLRSLGVWPAVERRRAYPFQAMHVWDAGGAGRIRFDAQTLGELQLGFVVENRVVQAALCEALAAEDNATLRFTTRPESLQVGKQVKCRLQAGGSVQARLLVGADGNDSWVRQAGGIAVSSTDYAQRAIVCNVGTEHPHEATAWQRFLRTGPLALLPLTAHECSIVWSADAPLAERLLGMQDAEFAARLNEAFGRRLGRLEPLSGRAGFPLRRQHAARYVQPRIALVGDAAHTIHPLAGQGVNLGILDAAALVDSLPAPDRDPGELRGLRAYERWRRSENQIMQLAMDGFYHTFGSGNYSVRWLRNAGLTLVDSVTPAKRFLARRAMGVAGDLPRLARAA
ncbi:MAG: UbiH/UbiF/VisC/COQ6 family ubiquinone biosynthesis hydroxylase [Gammaproteobacteria bacterium]|nr:UbiH/UbiF/VisC/COQ6 family ubiquinone biosynthesis hydroxylase [Gammaproteobacteria bacterium]